MVPHHAKAYRTVLRELKNATRSHRTVNKAVSSNFRAIFETYRSMGCTRTLDHDVENVITFMRSQRKHKILLERYNPLIDMTADDRIHATARRVGLDMPITHKS